MKQIEGKARRALRYDRMFFWYVPIGGIAGIMLGVAGTGWQWGPSLLVAFGGLLIGGVLGVLLRDAP